jgi:NitT/TauT family transport system substrate-binding protein
VIDVHHPLSRREFLRAAGLAGAGAVLLGACGSDESKGGPTSTPGAVVDPPPETTPIRLAKSTNNPRTAPIFLAEQFLAAEGFTTVQYIEVPIRNDGVEELAAGEIDMGIPFAPALTVAADRGDPIVVLAGVQSATTEVFGSDRVQSLRDLKGKRIWGGRDEANGAYAFWAALLAYVGIDIEREVEFVDLSAADLLAQAQEGNLDAWTLTRPISTLFRNANVGHVILDCMVDAPWSQHLASMATGNRDFVEQHPAATKRALRAILQAADVCASEPERAARYLVDRGYTVWDYDLTLDGIRAPSYTAWREFNPEDTVRFYALRLNEAGLVESTPDELIARATDWRYLDEIKQELAV